MQDKIENFFIEICKFNVHSVKRKKSVVISTGK